MLARAHDQPGDGTTWVSDGPNSWVTGRSQAPFGKYKPE